MLKSGKGGVTLRPEQLAELLSSLHDDSVKPGRSAVYSINLRQTDESAKKYDVTGIVKLDEEEVEIPMSVDLSSCLNDCEEGKGVDADSEDASCDGDPLDFSDEFSPKPAPIIAAVLGIATFAVGTIVGAVYVGSKIFGSNKG